jgi:hypothetical protein
MSDRVKVLGYLRGQFARLCARLNDMAQWQSETGARLTAIERHLAGVRRMPAGRSDRAH